PKDGPPLSGGKGFARKKILTIWTGIDATRFASGGPQRGGPVVMVGRLSFEKDGATLIRAAAVARRSFPAFQLQIAGEGTCMPGLQELTKELALEGAVQFRGEVHNIPELLAQSSFLVLPSLTEGISLTLLEAMARGLPVVATRVGGNPEVVLDGQTGFLVPVQQPDRLAERMVHLLQNPDLCRTMGQQARARVMQHFEVSSMVARYETLYQE